MTTIKRLVLYNHGCDLVSKLDLHNDRFIQNHKDKKWHYNLEILVRIRKTPELIQEYVEHNIMNIVEDLDLPREINNFCLMNKVSVVPRYGDNEYGMDWHFDNRDLVTQPITRKSKLANIEIVHEDNKKVFGLWDFKKRPNYTMIIYFTDHNVDHMGGELMFVDETICPKYGDVVFFNANELHKVNPTFGTRNALVINFYDLDECVNPQKVPMVQKKDNTNYTISLYKCSKCDSMTNIETNNEIEIMNVEGKDYIKKGKYWIELLCEDCSNELEAIRWTEDIEEEDIEEE